MMNLPKKIHYFWTGNNIPEKNLRKILNIKYQNPGFEVNIWGERNIQSLVINTLRKIKLKYHGTDFDIGEIPINFNYRNIETAFRSLAHQANTLGSVQLAKLNCLSFLTETDSRKKEENIQRYGDYVDLIYYLQHVYHLHIMGNYHNYAAASDIARLVILYMEGGIYLDSDVKLSDPDIKEMINRESAKFDDLYIQSDIALGDCTGKGWYSTEKIYQFGNAIIASMPQSKKTFDILIQMATALKRHHLYSQIHQSPKFNEISRIRSTNRTRQIDKRIDFALKLEKSNQLNLNVKCSMLNPMWRTGSMYPSQKVSKHDREKNRIDYTMKLTGPVFLIFPLNPKREDTLPLKHRLMSKINNDSVFKKVDASGKWAILKNKKYSDEN
ncbi:glycosyltransferase [Xenorhabdus miraniensis]|uniref:Subversion of eukaryotic traffic protein A n=1 Tax=Xenorhabdus miraniensis TaxID=351674 RepID=A0A2D0JVC1_9GAMM|nr:glycosyltransferase [Xenorhabdus miraniensis]PHM50309.1 hypothetical protein Xmir_00488 [Xenorhabdus miraniensis]